MIDVTTIIIGSILEFKKPHPCGNFKWLVLRTGVDLKLECTQCKRQIMIERKDISKRIKKIINE